MPTQLEKNLLRHMREIQSLKLKIENLESTSRYYLLNDYQTEYMNNLRNKLYREQKAADILMVAIKKFNCIKERTKDEEESGYSHTIDCNDAE